MSDISISLSNIHNVKNVLIEGLGSFKVRKLGAGEELDLSDRLRRLNKIIMELQNIDFDKLKVDDVPTDEQMGKVDKLQKRIQKLTDEINEIKRFELETYKRCFEDTNDGKNVDILLDSLSEDDRAALFTQIFDAPKQVEVTAPETAVEETSNG